MKTTLAERFRGFTAIPDQIEKASEDAAAAAQGIAILVAIAGLVALLALSVSLMALERTSRGN